TLRGLHDSMGSTYRLRDICSTRTRRHQRHSSRNVDDKDGTPLALSADESLCDTRPFKETNMGEDDRKSANKDASGIPRRECLRTTTLARSDVAAPHRLLNEIAVAATNHSPITMPGRAQATMPVRLNINGLDFKLRTAVR